MKKAVPASKRFASKWAVENEAIVSSRTMIAVGRVVEIATNELDVEIGEIGEVGKIERILCEIDRKAKTGLVEVIDRTESIVLTK